MTKSLHVLVIASLAVAGSTFAAPAALAAGAVHVPTVTSAVRAEARYHGAVRFVARPAPATQSHDHAEDPFADLLLG
jgi:hypothetical protein